MVEHNKGEVTLISKHDVLMEYIRELRKQGLEVKQNQPQVSDRRRRVLAKQSKKEEKE